MFKIQPKYQTNPQSLKIMESVIKQNQKLLYVRVSNSIVTNVCKDGNGILVIRQNSIETTVEIKTQLKGFSRAESKIDFAFIEGNDAFLVYKNPFQIYFITKQEETPIKLILGQQISFQSCIMDLSYPNIIIFGKKADSFKNQVFQLNLQTLGMKIINDGKGYTPGAREKQYSVLIDGRIYVFGGKEKKGNNCDKMIWVYDIEKGFWFALEMQYPQQQDFSICQSVPISSSKVLIINRQKGKSWVFEIHQSKITQIAGQVQLKDQYIFLNGQLISYSENSLNFENKKVVYIKQ